MKRKIAIIVVLCFAITTALGLVGFSEEDSLAVAAIQKVDFTSAKVTAQYLNVRQGASTKFPVVCVVKKGEIVKVFGKIDGWYAIYHPVDGCVGAVSGQYITPIYPPKPTTKPAPTVAPKPTTKPAATSVPTPTSAAKATPTPVTNAGTPVSATADEKAMLDLINKARSDNKLAPLQFDSALLNTARLKSKDMVTNNYFAHQSPTYGSPFDMMRQFGITFKTAGENIAGNQTIEGAFNAWMNSPGHRENILNPSYNYTGIGIVDSPTYGKIFTQQFIGR